MTDFTRLLLLALALLAVPMAGVRAQSADDCHCLPGAGPAANQPEKGSNVPGWTGRTVVVGSHSTVAGSATATRLQQTGQYGPQR